MSKSFKTGNELAESDFKKLSDWLYDNFGKRYTTNYIRRVLNENDKRKNRLISEVARLYLELKQEFEQKFKSNNINKDSNETNQHT